MNLSNTFGIDDNLKLEMLKQTKTSKDCDPAYLVKDQIRELKDENGRLHHLLKEKEFEIRRHQKSQSELKATANFPGISSDIAAMKIVELSKKLREKVAEIEVEKTKSNHLIKKYDDLKNEVIQKDVDSVHLPVMTDEKKFEELKQLQEKQKQTESKLCDWRNQCQVLKQDLKLANKVIAQEIGDGFNIHCLLAGKATWKGRAQQILTLQQKVSELKQELEQYWHKPSAKNKNDALSDETESTISEKGNKNQILRQLIKERKEAQEKTVTELKALQETHSCLKNKFDSLKARNQVVSNEMKTNKQQIQTLLEKGRHDDELIATLMNQHVHMKEIMEEKTQLQLENNQQQQTQMGKMSVKRQNEDNLVDHLKTIIAEKDQKLKLIENRTKELVQHQYLSSSSADNVGCGPCTPPLTTNTCQSEDSFILPTLASEQPEDNHLDVLQTYIFQNTDSSNHCESPTKQSSLTSQSAPINSLTSQSAPINSLTSQSAPSMETIQNSSKQDLLHEVNSKALQVERDQLIAYLKKLQSRLTDSDVKNRDIHQELVQLRQQNKILEQKVSIAKEMLNNSDKKGRNASVGGKDSGLNGAGLRNSIMTEEDVDTEQLQTKLSIQYERNEVLKEALQNTLRSKNEDFQMYCETIEQQKQIFLEVLQTQRQCSSD